MAEKQFTYAVARIRSKEMTLFGKQVIEQLMGCKTYQDCLRLLADKGWGDRNGSDEDMLGAEREKLWALMRELVEDMSVFDVFLYDKDYHNLKAAIKQACTKRDVSNIFMGKGTVDPDVMRNAVKEKDFDLLPETMRECAKEAYELQLKLNDSQMCDVVIDRACMEAVYRSGKASGIELFAGYAELKTASADILIALRSAATGKDRVFLMKALAPCDSLNLQNLTEAALNGTEAIYEYVATTIYSGAIDALKQSSSAFECWCDNRIMEQIQPQKANPFTVSPLAAYILARENEIKTVRIILSGKRNNLSEESVRERLREMYV